jgi:hypothetical protein
VAEDEELHKDSEPALERTTGISSRWNEAMNREWIAFQFHGYLIVVIAIRTPIKSPQLQDDSVDKNEYLAPGSLLKSVPLKVDAVFICIRRVRLFSALNNNGIHSIKKEKLTPNSRHI